MVLYSDSLDRYYNALVCVVDDAVGLVVCLPSDHFHDLLFMWSVKVKAYDACCTVSL